MQDAVGMIRPHSHGMSSTTNAMTIMSTDNASNPAPIIIGKPRPAKLHRDIADYYIIYSTTPETVSIRLHQHGCPLFLALSETIKELSGAASISFDEAVKLLKNKMHHLGTLPELRDALDNKNFLLPTKKLGQGMYITYQHNYTGD